MATKKVTKKEKAEVSEVAETKEEAAAKPAVKKTSKPAADLTKVDAKAVKQMKQDYFQYRLDVTLGKENDTAKLRKMRHDIARASMYLNMNKSN
jgi:ribosomal protein L29